MTSLYINTFPISAIALITIFLVCFTTAAPKPSQIESKLMKMEKLR